MSISPGPTDGQGGLRPGGAANLSRRIAIAAALTAPFIARAARPDFTLRVAHAAPSTFPLNFRLIEAAGQINLKSEGKVQVQVFADNSLGSPVGVLAQVRAGTLEAAALSNQTLTQDLTSMNLPMIGFAFPGYDRLWPALDGKLGALLTRQLHDRLGLVAVGRCWDFGFRQITTASRTIQTAADLNGMPVRTPADALFILLLQGLHARPITFSLAELDKALRTHAVEGQQGMIELALDAKLYQWQTHCALTNHIWDGHWLVFSRTVWDRIPATLQTVITSAFDDAAQAQRGDTAKNQGTAQATLEKAGMTFNAVTHDSFRDTLRDSGYYAAWRSKIPDEGWAMLESFTGPLTR